MAVLEFPRPKDSLSLQHKTESYQKVWRDWGPYLDPCEQILVLQLIDRTLGWGRREAYFTRRALLEGDTIFSGIKMGKTKFYEALGRLQAIGLVRRRRDAHVPDRVHFSVNMDWQPQCANFSQVRNEAVISPVRIAATPVRDANDPVRQADTIASNHKRVSQESILAGTLAPLPLKPTRKVQEERARSVTGSGASMEDQIGPQAAVEKVELAWRGSLIDVFPGTAYRTWGVREKAQVKTVLRSWRGDVTFPQFVTWAVTNWTAIMRKQFKWMTKSPPPPVPTLSFLIAFITQFADARAEGVLEDWLSAEDRTELQRMMGRGQTYEQATAELGRQKATVALRDEMTKREIAVRARDHGATRRLAEAKRLAELKGGIPMHPNSPNAQRLKAEELKARAARPILSKVLAPDGETLQGAEVFFVDPDRNPFDH